MEGRTRRIDWPENAFYHAPIPGVERDAVLLLGIEPNLRWQSFTKMIVDLARELEVKMLITLGSLLADVPHTRPSPVTGGATDPELIERLGLQRSRSAGAWASSSARTSTSASSSGQQRNTSSR